jgi:hypothetical protein
VKTLATVILFAGAALAQDVRCDFQEYKPQDGLKAEMAGGALQVSWRGERGDQLRASFTIRGGVPTIAELAIRKGGNWTVLARNLAPEFQVTSGVRRLSEQQMAPLRQLGIALTPEVIEREKWNAFWDAPLMVPGAPKTNLDLPRRPEEIRRAWAEFHSSACQARTDGARLEITFPGLSMGIFSGRLQYTIYRDSNLVRQEAIAMTTEPSVAYKYVAGVKGLAIDPATRIAWRDTARSWQQYRFGGSVNQEPVALRARNRLAIVETGGGSLAFLPPSHKFFFAREIETNLGYVYYRKDSDSSFAAGVRQADREDGGRGPGRVERGRDVVTDHRPLRRLRDLVERHRSRELRRDSPVSAPVGRRDVSDVELAAPGTGGVGIEVVGQRHLCRRPRRRRIDGEAGNEVIDAARDVVDRDPRHVAPLDSVG